MQNCIRPLSFVDRYYLLQVSGPDCGQLAHVVEPEQIGADDVTRRERHALDVRDHCVDVRLTGVRRRRQVS